MLPNKSSADDASGDPIQIRLASDALWQGLVLFNPNEYPKGAPRIAAGQLAYSFTRTIGLRDMLVEAIRYTGDAGFEHERVRLGESIARNALVVFDTHQILATFDAFSMSVVTMFDMLLDLLRTRIPGLDGLDGTDGKQLTSRLRSLRDTYPEAGRVLSLLQSHKHWIDDIVDLRHRAVHGPISPRVNGFLVLAAKGQPVPLSAEQVTPPTVRQLNGMIVPLADYARAACDGLHELAAEFRDIAYPPLERAARVES